MASMTRLSLLLLIPMLLGSKAMELQTSKIVRDDNHGVRTITVTDTYWRKKRRLAPITESDEEQARALKQSWKEVIREHDLNRKNKDGRVIVDNRDMFTSTGGDLKRSLPMQIQCVVSFYNSDTNRWQTETLSPGTWNWITGKHESETNPKKYNTCEECSYSNQEWWLKFEPEIIDGSEVQVAVLQQNDTKGNDFRRCQQTINEKHVKQRIQNTENGLYLVPAEETLKRQDLMLISYKKCDNSCVVQ